MSGEYGPQTEAVEALLEKMRNLTTQDVETLRSAHPATSSTVWFHELDRDLDEALDKAIVAAWEASFEATRYMAWYVMRDAVWALVVRHLISEEDFAILYGPWASVMEVGQ